MGGNLFCKIGILGVNSIIGEPLKKELQKAGTALAWKNGVDSFHFDVLARISYICNSNHFAIPQY